MNAICPHCGKQVILSRPQVPNKTSAGLSNDPEELYGLLNEPISSSQSEDVARYRHVYLVDNAKYWCVSFVHGKRFCRSAVDALVASGRIRQLYSSHAEAFYVGRTVDVEATRAAQKQNKHASIVYLEHSQVGDHDYEPTW